MRGNFFRNHSRPRGWYPSQAVFAIIDPMDLGRFENLIWANLPPDWDVRVEEFEGEVEITALASTIIVTARVKTRTLETVPTERLARSIARQLRQVIPGPMEQD